MVLHGVAVSPGVATGRARVILQADANEHVLTGEILVAHDELDLGLQRALARGERSKAAGWYVEFSWQGMPLRWTALEAGNPRLPAQGWQIAEVDLTQRPLLIRHKLLAADGRKPGELLTQKVGILLSTAR